MTTHKRSAEASWSPSLQLNSCRGKCHPLGRWWQQSFQVFLQTPLVNRQNKLHSKSKTVDTSQQNWIIRVSNPAIHVWVHLGFSIHAGGHFERSNRARSARPESSGTPSLPHQGAHRYSTGDGGPTWELQLKLGGALSPASTQTQQLHTRLYARVSDKEFQSVHFAARNVL